MKKRLLAMVLALVLVFSMLPSVVIAEGTEHVHCLCGANSTKGTVCADCLTKAVEWTAWDGTTAMADLAAGNYYLTQDITITSVQVISKDIAIDLCGNDITGNSNRFIYINGKTMSITDCTNVATEIGEISGFANEGSHPAVTISDGSTLNIYGGKFTNNISTQSNCGVLNVGTGGTLNMYGGEISGNTAVRGTIKGGTSADPYWINILGGTITGNQSTGTGNLGGGAGIYSFSPVTIGGNAKVYGNTGAEASKNQDIFLRNDSTYTGKIILSAEKPLKYGAQLNYGLWTAEADTTDLEYISGNPTNWKNVWVNYEGQKVGYADGAFFVDNGPADTDEEEVVPGVHIHCLCGAEKTAGKTCAECGSQAKEWTAIDAMPSVDDAGWYYLTANVTVVPFFATSGEFAFCLCGHTMVSAEGKRMLDASNGAVINITDCDGDDAKGIITGSTGATKYGSVMRANAGSTINIYNGKISGNTGASDGIIYADCGSTETPGGTINIYGGLITDNTCARGTVYTALGTGGKLPGAIKILGGVITGNTGTNTGNTSGGAGVYSFYPVEIGGNAQIYGNTAAEGPADLYLRDDQNQGASIVLSTEKPLEAGANVQYGSKNADDPADLALISGSPDVSTWDSTWIQYDGQKVGYDGSKFFVDNSAPAGHVHCLCGAETNLGSTCAKCGNQAVEWTEWEQTDALPQGGYYYLSKDVTTGMTEYKSGNTAICLHGNDIISKNGYKVMNVYNTATVSLTDCNTVPGKITGSNKETYGLVLRINEGGVLNMYGGHVTGNSGTATGDGVVYVDKGTTKAGGEFNMYGGEISGNTARRGGGVYTASGGNYPATVRILGGTITGNHSTGTGSTGGGGGILSFYPVEVGGDAKIYGNTSALAGAEDIYLRNDDSFAGALLVSSTKPLEAGAQIAYSLKTPETILDDLQFIGGTPDESTWDSTWIHYDGNEVGYADGKFFAKPSSDSHVHCMCGAEKTFQAICAKCGTKAVMWTGITSMPTATAEGYYYLKNDVAVAPFFVNSDREFAFCLCGHTMTSAEGKRMFDLQTGAVISFTDCAEEVGSITGTTGVSANGTAIRVNAGSTLNLWNGKITGHTGDSDGTVYVDIDKNNTYGVGGTFNMYGGEISGNTARRGVIYAALPTSEQTAGVVRILGGVITGNTGTGTGNYMGGAGVLGLTDIEVGGNAQIYGNTAASGPADIYIRDDQGAQLVISTDVPLTEGARIVYGTKGGDDPEDLQFITGTPDQATWNFNWVTYDGEPVKYKDGKFFTAAEIVISGHDHGGYSWISMTEETKLVPNKSGYYVLDGDVTLPRQLVLSNVEITICLNGHTLTAADGAGHFDLQAGTKLTICDCTAKTAKDGKYTAGQITGGNGAQGGFARMREGSELYLYDGIITGNKTAGNGGVVYMNAGTSEQPGAIFVMYGGELSKNYGGYGGAVRLGAPTGDNKAGTFRMEGGVICDNESPNLGGAIHAAGNATLELIGGVIENNVAAKSGGAVSINGTSTVNLSGTTIRNNKAETHGAGMYISAGATVNITGGEISGNSSKIGAGILIQSKGTVLNMSGGKITGNKAGQGGAAGLYASNNTVFNMTGGEISYNESEVGGGGMVLCGMTASITGGKITGNKSKNAGAGMAIQGSEVTLGKVIISENVSEGGGGGIYVTRTGSICANVIIDGAQIIKNTCATSGGGIFMYMNGNAITMKSGKINNNKAKDGGGVVSQREVTFTLEGGEICNNTAVNGGGGYYASIDSTFIMNGGSISGNYAGKSGGGVTCLRADLVKLNGGNISYNTTETGSAAGVNINGTYAEMNGTWVTNNKTKDASGGGVMVNSTTAKVDGVSTRFAGRLVMTGGKIANNFTPRAGGGLLLQAKDTVATMYGGSITENVSTKFAAGVYVGKNATFNMHGGEVSYNKSENDVAAGIRHDGGFGNYTGGEIHHNVSPRSGAGFIVGGTDNKVTMKNVKIYANEAKVGGGFVLQSKGCQLIMEDCEIYDNKATQEGAGAYIYTYCYYTAKNCHFHDNVCQGNGGGIWSWATSYVTLDGCLIENNQSVNGQGGAVWTRGDGFDILNCTIQNNTAAGDGGAVYAGMMGTATGGYTPNLKIQNTVIQNNTSGGMGGGLFQSSGSRGNLIDVQFLNNTAAAECGALWAKDEFSMYNVTAIGNKSGGEGYAIILDDSEFDGHSYVAGLMKIGGSMKIYDNPGGDMYIGEKTVLTIVGDGLAEDSKINLTLHSGLVTQMVWGAYDYEGGDLVYTITHGNRSITDPEIPTAEPEAPVEDPTQGGESAQTPDDQKDDAKGSVGLYIGIGAVVAVIAAAAVIIVAVASKKKKVTK